MTRLFIAVDIPEKIKAQVAGMGGPIPRAFPLPEDQLHLTLKFIGEVDGSIVLDIQEELEEVSFHPFSLSLRGTGIFPPRGTPRVLWLGVEPDKELRNLRRIIEKRLLTRDIPADRRKFAPHITVARLKNCPLKRLHQFLAGNSFFRSPEFPVERFSLYSSRLTPKGAIHTLLKSYYL